jgi:uncharacterized protein YgiM (DUF1202 family)
LHRPAIASKELKMARTVAAVVLLCVATFFTAMLIYGLLTYATDRLQVAILPKVYVPVAEPVYGGDLPVAKPEDLNIATSVPVAVSLRQDSPASAEPSFTHTVAAEWLRVRAGPKKNTPQLFALEGGTQVTVIKEIGGWFLITAGGDSVGWVYGKLLRTAPQKQASLE